MWGCENRIHRTIRHDRIEPCAPNAVDFNWAMQTDLNSHIITIAIIIYHHQQRRLSTSFNIMNHTSERPHRPPRQSKRPNCGASGSRHASLHREAKDFLPKDRWSQTILTKALSMWTMGKKWWNWASLPSRELTCPMLGEKNSFKSDFWWDILRDMLVPWRDLINENFKIFRDINQKQKECSKTMMAWVENRISIFPWSLGIEYQWRLLICKKQSLGNIWTDRPFKRNHLFFMGVFQASSSMNWTLVEVWHG